MADKEREPLFTLMKLNKLLARLVGQLPATVGLCLDFKQVLKVVGVVVVAVEA